MKQDPLGLTSYGVTKLPDPRRYRRHRGDHCCAAGIEVNVKPLKRRPRTATLPELTVNWADPRLPTTADNPGMLRKKAAILAPAAKGTDDVPITPPELFQT